MVAQLQNYRCGLVEANRGFAAVNPSGVIAPVLVLFLEVDDMYQPDYSCERKAARTHMRVSCLAPEIPVLTEGKTQLQDFSYRVS